MFLINGKEPTAAQAKFVKERQEQLRKILKFPLRFKEPEDRKTDVIFVDKNMRRHKSIRYPQGHFVKLGNMYNDGKQTAYWQYYEKMIYRDKEGNVPVPRKAKVEHNMVINEKDIDLAVYLIFMSGHCDDIEGIDGFQNKQKKRIYMVLDDERMQARKEAEKFQKELQVNEIIYGEALGEEKLRLLAKSYFVPDVDNIDEIAIIQNKLRDKVVKTNDPSAVDKFIDAAEVPDIVKIKALVQDARDKRIIGIKEDSGIKHWHFLDEDGNFVGKPITSFRPSEKPNQALTNVLIANSEYVKTFEAELKDRKK